MQSLHGHGEGSSPVLYGEKLIINWDHEGKSFAAALNKRTGQPIWKVDRTEVTSWATPIVVEHAGKPQVIISGTSRIRGYDLATGKVLWECGGLSANVGSSYDKRALLAIRLDGAAGDITDSKTQIAWSRFRGTPYVPSPMIYQGGLYFLTHYQGILTRVDAVSGEDSPGAMRLGDIGDIYASPVAAAGRIYVTDLNGATAVIAAGEIPRLLGINRLSEPIAASAALSGREMFLRGEKHLYAIAEPAN
jgi:outer membrane protein assembly factor BamB